MKNKLLVILLVFLLCFMSFGNIYAASEVSVIVDGKTVQFDVPPQLIGGRTMVPLRAIFEALGAKVEWDATTKTITAYNEAYIVKCTINSNVMYVNNVSKTIDVAPMIVNNRALVPARFVAEGFNCDVQWDAEKLLVTITSKPIDYNSIETDNNYPAPEQTTSSVVNDTNKGTRANPYSASDAAIIDLQAWSWDPIRQVSVTCTNIIRGSQAAALAKSENSFNKEPTSGQEWIFFEFNVKYVSSENGLEDELAASDIIYYDQFYTGGGTSLKNYGTASLNYNYEGCGVFDVDLYPGGESKIIMGILTDKGIDPILLCIPKNGGDSKTWINCTSSSKTPTASQTNTETTISQKNISYYSGSTLPTYTSIVGRTLKDTVTFEDGGIGYVYEHDIDEYALYIVSLEAYGWSEYKHEMDDTSLTYYMIKDDELVSIVYSAAFSEVWILLT